ncbi:T-lymphocyte surface antigen Ly-9-like isoform X2 [Heptranchias perlo]|uniref:T-lymphocyte surface antigen Ly-9-like isoform X2 n=1 Tax=Heptranchias perlo TaxID=212740 RepID=UPI00355A6FA5
MWQLCAGRVWSLVCVFLFAICVGEIQTLRPPVNGTLGQSIVLPVGIPPTPEDVEVVWKRKEPDARIARYMNGNVKTFGTEEYTRRIKFHPENYSLQISGLQREDSGVYEVIVTGELGRETSELVRLDVYERVSGTNITATVTQGICNITLTCSVTSGDRTSFRWWRGREELGNDSNHYLSGHGEELRIYYTSDVKESVYRCEAWNPVRKDIAQVELSGVCNITVSGEIQTLRPPVNGTLGQSIVLPVGIPPTPEDVEVVWKRKEPDARIARYTNKNVETFGTDEYTRRIKFHPENYSLQISDLQREDSGVYEVIVTGELGRETSELVRLDVYERVSGTKIRSTVTQGICNITLTCSVTSGDLTSFRWWRGREELGNDSNHYLSGYGEELRIYYTSDVKESVYRCEAWNAVSKDTAQVELSDVCNIPVSGVSVTNSSDINCIALLLVFLIPCVAFSIYKCRRHSSRSEGLANAADGRSFERASVPNNYVNSENPESPPPVSAEVQRSSGT